MAEELVPGFTAETELERRLLADPELREGLAWGAARPGHPEGRVGVHVADILEDIGAQDPHRPELRFIALVHDSFKFRVDPKGPRTRDNDHAWLARRFAERYTADPRILETIELHDEAYRHWRDGDRGDDALDDILPRIPDLPLYVGFVELDASTEGKDFSFLFWLRFMLARRGLLPPAPASEPAPRATTGEPATAYVQSFETDPADQDAVAAALAEVAADRGSAGAVEVMRSVDGTRVALLIRWEGESAPHLLAARSVARRALGRHPIILRTKPLEAHSYTIVRTLP